MLPTCKSEVLEKQSVVTEDLELNALMGRTTLATFGMSNHYSIHSSSLSRVITLGYLNVSPFTLDVMVVSSGKSSHHSIIPPVTLHCQ